MTRTRLRGKTGPRNRTQFSAPLKHDLTDEMARLGLTLKTPRVRVGEWNEGRVWLAVDQGGKEPEFFTTLKGDRVNWKEALWFLAQKFPEAETWPE